MPDTAPKYSLACPIEHDAAQCCFIGDKGKRCVQLARFEVRGVPVTWDDYTLVCGDHAAIVANVDDAVTPWPRPAT